MLFLSAAVFGADRNVRGDATDIHVQRIDSVRAPGFQVFVDNGNGRLVQVEAASRDDCERRLKSFNVAPSKSNLQLAFQCDAPALAVGHEITPTGGGGSTAPGEHVVCAEIAFEVDASWYANFNDVVLTQAWVEAMMANANLQFETQLGIRHEITAIIIHTGPPAGGLFNFPAMQDRWEAEMGHIQRDMAFWLIDSNSAGGAVNVVGSMCSDTVNAYGVVTLQQFARTVDVLEHEIAHIWGAGHCVCGWNTMHSGYVAFIQAADFSDGSLSAISAARDAASCVDVCEASIPPAIPTPAECTLDSLPQHWSAAGGVEFLDGEARLAPGSHLETAAFDLTAQWGARVALEWTGDNAADLDIEYMAKGYAWISLYPLSARLVHTQVEDGTRMTKLIVGEQVAVNDFPGFRVRLRAPANQIVLRSLQIDPYPANPCPADTNIDRLVDHVDLGAVVIALGDHDSWSDVAPLNADGTLGNNEVNVDDIVAVLNSWGPCPDF